MSPIHKRSVKPIVATFIIRLFTWEVFKRETHSVIVIMFVWGDQVIDGMTGVHSSAGGNCFWLRNSFENSKLHLFYDTFNVSPYIYTCLYFICSGFTRVPSTGFPAERSDSLSTQDTLARSVFQVPQWLVCIVFYIGVSFGQSVSSSSIWLFKLRISTLCITINNIFCA